jgi:hypothetical protein
MKRHHGKGKPINRPRGILGYSSAFHHHVSDVM